MMRVAAVLVMAALAPVLADCNPQLRPPVKIHASSEHHAPADQGYDCTVNPDEFDLDGAAVTGTGYLRVDRPTTFSDVKEVRWTVDGQYLQGDDCLYGSVRASLTGHHVFRVEVRAWSGDVQVTTAVTG